MKCILRHTVFAITVSFGLGAFYIYGFSESSWRFFAAIVLIGGIAGIGMKHGFNKPLPKRNPSEITISLIRKVFGIALAIIAIRTIGLGQVELLIGYRSFLFGLWLWIMVEIAIDCIKEYKVKNQDSNHVFQRDR